jgi:hypothetical protein
LQEEPSRQVSRTCKALDGERQKIVWVGGSVAENVQERIDYLQERSHTVTKKLCHIKVYLLRCQNSTNNWVWKVTFTWAFQWIVVGNFFSAELCRFLPDVQYTCTSFCNSHFRPLPLLSSLHSHLYGPSCLHSKVIS